MVDSALGRFWEHRSEHSILREKQLLIDFLCSSSGGPLLYTGLDMMTSHKGMRISESDWSALVGHISDTLDSFNVPAQEKGEVLAFIESTKAEIVEA